MIEIYLFANWYLTGVLKRSESFLESFTYLQGTANTSAALACSKRIWTLSEASDAVYDYRRGRSWMLVNVYEENKQFVCCDDMVCWTLNKCIQTDSTDWHYCDVSSSGSKLAGVCKQIKHMIHDSAATLQARHYISLMHPESLAKMTLTKVKTHIIGWPEQTHTTHNTHTQRMPGILSGALHGKHFAALYPRTVADRAAHWPAYAKHAAAKPTCLPPALFIGFFVCGYSAVAVCSGLNAAKRLGSAYRIRATRTSCVCCPSESECNLAEWRSRS